MHEWFDISPQTRMGSWSVRLEKRYFVVWGEKVSAGHVHKSLRQPVQFPRHVLQIVNSNPWKRPWKRLKESRCCVIPEWHVHLRRGTGAPACFATQTSQSSIIFLLHNQKSSFNAEGRCLHSPCRHFRTKKGHNGQMYYFFSRFTFSWKELPARHALAIYQSEHDGLSSVQE